jgi:hypothetical protein
MTTNTWQPLKIGAGGFVRGIDVAPDGTLVVRTDTYGAYIWDGSQWQQLVTTASLPAAFVAANFTSSGDTLAQGVYEIAIAPSDSNILYMSYDGYVLKSSDKGNTWTQTSFAQVTEDPNDAYGQDGQKMAVDPNNPNVVYVGTPQNGLFVSSDGGSTWQSVSAVPVSATDSGGNYPGISGIVFDPALGVSGGLTNTIFAASYGHGVYESTKAGASWSLLTGGPTSVVYATVSSSGVYYASDGSTLWSYANGSWTQLLSDANDGIQSVAVDPNNANEIVTQTPSGYLNISYDAGATWSGPGYSSNQVSSSDIPWLAQANTATAGYVFMDVGGTVFNPLVPNQLISSAGTGVWNAMVPTAGFNQGTPVTWNDQSVGIEQLVANEIIVPTSGHPVLASWDRPFFYVANPNAYPATYGPVNSVNIVAGWSVDYASSNPNFLVGIADWGSTEESGYSTDGGQTWTPFPTFVPGVPNNFEGGSIAASTPSNIVWRRPAVLIRTTRSTAARPGRPSPCPASAAGAVSTSRLTSTPARSPPTGCWRIRSTCMTPARASTEPLMAVPPGRRCSVARCRRSTPTTSNSTRCRAKLATCSSPADSRTASPPSRSSSRPTAVPPGARSPT